MVANWRFWGWSYSGTSDLSTIGGSLNSIFLKNQAFHVYLGSMIGSSSFLYCLLKKLGAFSGLIFLLRVSRSNQQLTKRYLYFFPISLYSRAFFKVIVGQASQIIRLMSQRPWRMAQSRTWSPQLLTISGLAPLLSKYSTISALPLLAAPMRAVQPAVVWRSMLAANFSRSSWTTSMLLFAAALCRGVVLQLTERFSLTRCGLLVRSSSILGISFFSMYQRRYSLDVQVWVRLFTAPILSSCFLEYNFYKKFKQQFRFKQNLQENK